MSQCVDLLIQSEFALAAYANLTGNYEHDKAALGKPDMLGMTEAENFLSKYKVVTQCPEDIGGSSATVFEEIVTGKRFLGIRGTESVGDFTADGILAAGFPSYLNPQFVRLKAQVSQWLANGTLSSGFSVTGHSLGGYLAVAIGTWFSGQTIGIYTYNAPGLGGIVGNALDAFRSAFGLSALALVDGIVNVRGTAGISLISGLGTQLSPPLFIETESNLNPIANHSIVGLTDSLAVYNLFFKLDNVLANSSLNDAMLDLEPTFKAASAKSNETLESLVNAIGKLLVPSYLPVNVGNREELYSRINQIYPYMPASGAYVIPMANKPIANVIENAKTNDNDGLAFRYALKELNPFVVLGLDYSNSSDALSLINPVTGSGNISDSWIDSRAAMLAWVIKGNTEDAAMVCNVMKITSDSPTLGTQSCLFVDQETQKKILVVPTSNSNLQEVRKIEFGKDSGGTITGMAYSDMLYGGSGMDKLFGLGGNDFVSPDNYTASVNRGYAA